MRLARSAFAGATLVVAAVALRRFRPASRTDALADADGGGQSGGGRPLVCDRGRIGASPDAHLVAGPGEPRWLSDLATWIPEPPRTRLGRLVAIIWALPATLGGLLLGALSATRPRITDGVVLFAGVRGLAGTGLGRGGFAATTLGHVVLTRSKTPSRHLMAHELAHTRQAERLGPLMGPLYWYLLARYGYARHPMERAARRAGRTARKPETD